MRAKPTTHTPGPWHRNVSPAWKYPIYADKNGDPNGKDWIHIAAVLPGNPNAEADLNLIAAAPELLEMCKLALARLPQDDFGNHARKQIMETIAKAEGRDA